ncbi:MAG TPA: adenylate/guanylate cyclase domain-containing protein [Phenylobacterium sp.]|uniref:adenylate/guanylate cyclase domain-containing protein n=1 Tax=Phenylobacterium sp. TaxID=1871053 RepID=UPI002F94B619
MTLSELAMRVDEILATRLEERAWDVAPFAEEVPLRRGAATLEAAFLYADFAGSYRLSAVMRWETTARVLRAYLVAATRLIKKNHGDVRSFDGDRVMGVFTGPSRYDDAVRCALQIDYAVERLIVPKVYRRFPGLERNRIEVGHGVGVDAGLVRAVQAGIRNNNDLIWIGQAPSFAAKLSDIRAWPYTIHISEGVYDALPPELRRKQGRNLWSARMEPISGEMELTYRTRAQMAF